MEIEFILEVSDFCLVHGNEPPEVIVTIGNNPQHVQQFRKIISTMAAETDQLCDWVVPLLWAHNNLPKLNVH